MKHSVLALIGIFSVGMLLYKWYKYYFYLDFPILNDTGVVFGLKCLNQDGISETCQNGQICISGRFGQGCGNCSQINSTSWKNQYHCVYPVRQSILLY